MIESFGSKKPYEEDLDFFADEESDPFSEETVNLIITKRKGKPKSVKNHEKKRDNSENQEIPDVISLF